MRKKYVLSLALALILTISAILPIAARTFSDSEEAPTKCVQQIEIKSWHELTEVIQHVWCPDAEEWFDIVPFNICDELFSLHHGVTSIAINPFHIPSSSDEITARNPNIWVTCCSFPSFFTFSTGQWVSVAGVVTYLGTLYTTACSNCGHVQSSWFRPA